MKKKLILMVLIVSSSLFSSCLKNEESLSILALREAKVGLINAETQYRIAEAALVQANVEYQNSLTANQQLLNELQVLMNDRQELENQIAACDVELAKLRVEVAQAATEASIAHFEALIAECENEKAAAELDLLNTKNAMELAIEQHKIDMANILAQVAEAEKAYQDALDLLEAEKLILTPEEQAMIDSYISALIALKEGGTYTFNGTLYTVTRGITQLQHELVVANDELARDKYMWDKASALQYARIDSVAAQAGVAIAQEVLERFREFTEADGIEGWEAKAEDIEGRMKTLYGYGDSLEVLKSAIERDIANVELKKQDINNQIDYIRMRQDSVATNPIGTDDPDWTKKGNLELLHRILDGAYRDSKFDRELNITGPGLQDLIYTQVIKGNEAGVTVSSGFQKDRNTGLYILDGDKYSFSGNIDFTDDDQEAIQNFESTLFGWITGTALLTENQVAIRTQELKMDTDDFDAVTKPAYEKALEDWTAAVTGFKVQSEIYLMGREQDLQYITKEVVNHYYTLPTTPTDADKLVLVDAVKKFRTVRDLLENIPYTVTVGSETKPIQDLISITNLATITEAQVRAAVDAPATLLYNSDFVAPDGLMGKWHSSSLALWGLSYIMDEINADTFVDCWSLIMNTLVTPAQVMLHYSPKVLDILQGLGYAYAEGTNKGGDGSHEWFTGMAYEGGLWWEYVSKQYRLAVEAGILAKQEDIAKLADDGLAYLTEETEIQGEYDAECARIDAEILAVMEEAESFEIYIFELNDQLEIEDQNIVIMNYILNLTNQEITNNDNNILALNALKAKYLDFIESGYNFLTGSGADFVNSDEVKAAFAAQILVYEEEVVMAQEVLYDAVKVLDMLYADLDGQSLAYKYTIDEDEADIEKITAMLETLNERFDYFTDLLKKTLAIFNGTDTAE